MNKEKIKTNHVGGTCDLSDTGFVFKDLKTETIVPRKFKNRIAEYLSITDSAIKRIKKIIKLRNKKTAGIKISILKKGCSGMAYKIEFADYGINLTDEDDLIKTKGIRIFIDPKASIFLIGSEMDFEDGIMKSGFVFNNPNEKRKCHCGGSFGV